MPRNKRRIVVPPVEEEVKIAVTMAIKQFKLDDAKEYTFPSSLTSEHRAFVHHTALEYNLQSKSRGKGPNRFVTVFKPEGSTIMQDDATMGMCPVSFSEINTLILQFPVSARERQEIMPYIDRDNTDLRRLDPSMLIRNGINGRVEVNRTRDTSRMMGRLNTGVPGIPPVASPPTHLMKIREELPIASMRDEIINLINGNQVVIISGETGSGKTTQVPQFILEHCQANSKSCRIICAQPRRISAVSVSERVAAERGEELGYIVGYQIRLESKTSPRSLLTYCTYGVLLRSLMVGDAALSATTHVIVDEVHERDRHCDFLMLVLRDMLARCRGLRLVLMSATVDTAMLTNYFRGAASISVPGRLYDVKEYFLEDILRETGYVNKKMQNYPEELKHQAIQNASLQQWNQEIGKFEPAPSTSEGMETSEEQFKLQQWLTDDLDETMEEAWYTGNNEAFDKLVHILRSQNVPIDYQHSCTSATSLMIAAARNKPDIVQKLLSLNADPDVKACNGFTALDWAKETIIKLG
ncbi:hypothetical protein B566_EDAN016096 [Ephemera danica]|nr:hypothetical protein B566_EDAN016096 [Ephemera danica]